MGQCSFCSCLDRTDVMLLPTVLLAVFASGHCQGGLTTQEDPCQTKTGLVADREFCDRYWACEGGQANLYDCPNGLVFVAKNRGIADGCDYPWSSPQVCTGKTMANGPISTEKCPWLYGIFGHATSCTRYQTCWNGTATEQFCIGGLLYSEETHACDWPDNVQGCQKHPLCKDDPNGNVRLGTSCERYWACQGGYPRLQRCSATLVFDQYSKRCVTGPTADCEAVTFPPPVQSEAEARPAINPANRARRRRPQSQQQPQEARSNPSPQARPSRPVSQNRPQPQITLRSSPSLQNQAPIDQQPQEQRVPVLEQDPQDYVYEEDLLDPVLSEDQGVSNLQQISDYEEQPLIEPVSQPRRPTPTQQSNRGGGGQFRPLSQRRSRRPPIQGAVQVN